MDGTSRLTCHPPSSERVRTDREEPVHVHVERDDASAKFGLDPVRLQGSQGFDAREIQRVRRIVEQHAQALRREWNAFFSD